MYHIYVAPRWGNGDKKMNKTSKTQQLIDALPLGPFAYSYDPGQHPGRPEDYLASSSSFRVISDESELLPHEQLITRDELMLNRRLAASASYQILKKTEQL